MNRIKQQLSPIFEQFRTPLLPLVKTVLIAIVLYVADFIIRYPYLSVLHGSDRIYYLFSLTYEVTFFFVLLWMLASLGKLRIAGIISVAFVLSVLQMLWYGHYYYFGTLPNNYSLNYILDHYDDTSALVVSSIAFNHGFLLLGLVAANGLLMRYSASFVRQIPSMVRGGFLILLILLSFICNNNVRFASASFSFTPNALFSLKYVLQQRLSGNGFLIYKGYVKRHFTVPSQQVSNPRFNVILFIGEGIRQKSMGYHGSGRSTSPFVDSLIQAGRIIAFTQHYTNAVSTQYSVPMTLSGIFTSAKPDVPYIYDYVKSCSESETFFFSSQALRTSTIDLLYNSMLDTFVCKENSGHEEFNDLGIDDMVLVADVARYLQQRQYNKFFGVIQFNNTHYPYSVKKGQSDFYPPLEAGSLNNYESVVRETDDIVRQYFSFFRSMNLLDSTIFIFTSDHGEAFGEHNHRGHLQTLYAEDVAIPLWIYLPGSAPASWASRLRQNARVGTSNLDIFPTILDIYDIEDSSGRDGSLSGQSLLRSLLPSRIIPLAGVDMIEIHGYIANGWKYLRTNQNHQPDHEAFDLFRDINEEHNCWKAMSEQQQNTVKSLLHTVGQRLQERSDPRMQAAGTFGH